MKRQLHYSALLIHISSLPSPFGIGTLGPECLAFLQQMRDNGFSYWQILPCTLVDDSNSPYRSYSAIAGNPYFLDPRILAADGLLTAQEVEGFVYKGPLHQADYSFAKKNIRRCLEKAKKRISSILSKSIEDFVKADKLWLQDYAIFMAAKDLYEQKPWWEWPNRALREHQEEAINSFLKDYEEEVFYYYFEQWAFRRQWLYIKSQANALGLGIIGDLPFYLSHDSVDVWSHRSLFDLDEEGQCKEVAGVPPDYFTPLGQKWGNPLYLWKNHQKDSFAWWKFRLEKMLTLYDKVRIDHFRAIVNYYAIPAEDADAKKGQWKEGPGEAFLAALVHTENRRRIIAEDLGEFDQGVQDAIRKYKLCNMHVLQFALHPSEEQELPYNYKYRSVTYTGTHDNNTLLGWIWDRNEEERAFVLDYLHFSKKEDWGEGGFESPICRAVMRQAWASPSKIAITCLQDLCGFGSDTRMNIPGKAEGNWLYRVQPGQLQQIRWQDFKIQNQIFRRDYPYEEGLRAGKFEEKLQKKKKKKM